MGTWIVETWFNVIIPFFAGICDKVKASGAYIKVDEWLVGIGLSVETVLIALAIILVAIIVITIICKIVFGIFRTISRFRRKKKAANTICPKCGRKLTNCICATNTGKTPYERYDAFKKNARAEAKLAQHSKREKAIKAKPGKLPKWDKK